MLTLGASLIVCAAAETQTHLSHGIYSLEAKLKDALSSTWLNDVRWKPDGQQLAIASTSSDKKLPPLGYLSPGRDGSVQIFSAADWSASPVLLSSPTVDMAGPVDSIDWSPTGEFLAVGARNGTMGVRIFETNSWGLVRTIPLNVRWGWAEERGLRWSSSGKLAVVWRCSDDGENEPPEDCTDSLWVFSDPLDSGSALPSWSAPMVGSDCVCWSADGSMVGAGGNYNWEYQDLPNYAFTVFSSEGTKIAELDLAELDIYDSVESCEFFPDGTRLVLGTDGETALVYETSTWTMTQPLPTSDDGVIVAVSADGSVVATGDDDDEVKLWTYSNRLAHSGKLVAVQKFMTPNDYVTGLHFSVDGRLAVIEDDKNVLVLAPRPTSYEWVPAPNIKCTNTIQIAKRLSDEQCRARVLQDPQCANAVIDNEKWTNQTSKCICVKNGEECERKRGKTTLWEYMEVVTNHGEWVLVAPETSCKLGRKTAKILLGKKSEQNCRAAILKNIDCEKVMFAHKKNKCFCLKTGQTCKRVAAKGWGNLWEYKDCDKICDANYARMKRKLLFGTTPVENRMKLYTGVNVLSSSDLDGCQCK